MKLTSTLPGPSGAPGPPGRAGIPAEMFLIQTPDGEPAIERWERDVPGSEEGRVAEMEHGVAALAGHVTPIPRSHVLTPQWRARS